MRIAQVRVAHLNKARSNPFTTLGGAAVLVAALWELEAGLPDCTPGWAGQELVAAETLAGWAVECDAGSSGELELVPGVVGNDLRLNYDLGTGSWVQARYNFATAIDLSEADLFGLSLRGDGGAVANVVAIMFADVNGVFQGYDMPGRNRGINQVGRWLVQLPLPKKVFWRFWGPGSQPIDWSRINRLFVVVKRPDSTSGGGAGQLTIDEVRFDRAALWPRQGAWAMIDRNAAPVQAAFTNAVGYLLSQQKSNGLFLSWREEPSPKAWLYDQALVLLALTREGRWQGGVARNPAAQAASNLVRFLTSAQKADDHWARSWNPNTGAELSEDQWVGDQAWCVMALADYASRTGAAAPWVSAQRGAQWLTNRIESTGKIRDVASTEGTVDVWWAMVSTLRFAEADRIGRYLLDSNTVWDAELKYWWRGAGDPVVAMDAATWLSAFARHPLVNQPERGLAALSFVGKTLRTTSGDGLLCGLDGQGPVSIWNEGFAQYIAAGGEGAPLFLPMLLAQQNQDGSMPGSPDNWTTDAFGWLTDWSGLAPTAWLYFALTGMPFTDPARDRDGDGAPDWREHVAGTDPDSADPYLKIEAAEADGVVRVALQFLAVSNRTHTVQYRDAATGAPWQNLTNFGTAPTNRIVLVTNTLTGVPQRYYQLLMPQVP